MHVNCGIGVARDRMNGCGELSDGFKNTTMQVAKVNDLHEVVHSDIRMQDSAPGR